MGTRQNGLLTFTQLMATNFHSIDAQQVMHWTSPFTSLLSDTVKLVGPSHARGHTHTHAHTHTHTHKHTHLRHGQAGGPLAHIHIHIHLCVYVCVCVCPRLCCGDRDHAGGPLACGYGAVCLSVCLCVLVCDRERPCRWAPRFTLRAGRGLHTNPSSTVTCL